MLQLELELLLSSVCMSTMYLKTPLLYICLTTTPFLAFVEGLCWTITAERQTSRIRKEYLKSVLRQEVGFFDNQDASCSTFQVVSTISADAHLIQDVIAEKVLCIIFPRVIFLVYSLDCYIFICVSPYFRSQIPWQTFVHLYQAS